MGRRGAVLGAGGGCGGERPGEPQEGAAVWAHRRPPCPPAAAPGPERVVSGGRLAGRKAPPSPPSGRRRAGGTGGWSPPPGRCWEGGKEAVQAAGARRRSGGGRTTAPIPPRAEGRALGVNQRSCRGVLCPVPSAPQPLLSASISPPAPLPPGLGLLHPCPSRPGLTECLTPSERHSEPPPPAAALPAAPSSSPRAACVRTPTPTLSPAGRLHLPALGSLPA